eukprot:scaffold3410_cov158-Amphora_coffeaeformis.AAC.1
MQLSHAWNHSAMAMEHALPKPKVGALHFLRTLASSLSLIPPTMEGRTTESAFAWMDLPGTHAKSISKRRKKRP